MYMYDIGYIPASPCAPGKSKKKKGIEGKVSEVGLYRCVENVSKEASKQVTRTVVIFPLPDTVRAPTLTHVSHPQTPFFLSLPPTQHVA